jgi:hypothetical protein
MNKTALVVFTILAITFPALSGAQGSTLSIPGQINDIQEQISTSMEPRIPAPGDTVTITLAAYGTDLNRANITWTRNGRVELKGDGEKVFTFTAAKLGGTDTIIASIKPVNGPVVEKKFTISPAEVDLLWEAKTYTPPFYKGKALFTPQADVIFVAMPNMVVGGSKVATNKASYKWSTDYVVAGDKSGLGKNTFAYTGSIILSPHVFKVETYAASDPKVTAKSDLTLEAVDPSVNIYEDHPLYGILFNKSLLGDFNMNDKEKRISAYPYFFSSGSRGVDLTYQWSINDERIVAPETESSMSFRKTASDSGTAGVKVRVNSTKNLLQQAFGYVALYFNSGNSVFLRQ